MQRCDDCVHFKVCAWCIDADHCAFFDTKNALKADGARGVLAEIEQLFDKYPVLHSIGGNKLAELKKKYAGGDNHD